MKLQEIERIVKLMAENDLTEFKIEAEEYNLCIKRGCDRTALLAPATHILQPSTIATAGSVAAPAPAAAAAAVAKTTVDSPIVGTFYRAASPEAAPFAKIGDKVTPETVVCIIEAMKVMNEIKAEKTGVIKEILVENATPVEFGQPLFVLE